MTQAQTKLSDAEQALHAYAQDKGIARDEIKDVSDLTSNHLRYYRICGKASATYLMGGPEGKWDCIGAAYSFDDWSQIHCDYINMTFRVFGNA